MNVSILQENLLRTLTKTGRIVSPNGQLPIMQNVLLSVEGARFTVTATSLELTEVVASPAKIEQDGGICVSSRLFTDCNVASSGNRSAGCKRRLSSCAKSRGERQYSRSRRLRISSSCASFKKTGHKDTKKPTSLCFVYKTFCRRKDEGRPLLTGIKLVKKDGGVTV